jgi:hypothetical protein
MIDASGGIISSAMTPQPDYKAQAAQLYQTHLGRAGDATGIDYWAGELAKGASMGEATQEFLKSARTTENNYLTDPNDANRANPETNALLAQDVKTGIVPGTVAGSGINAARTGLTGSVFANLYGAPPVAPVAPVVSTPAADAAPSAATYAPTQLADPTKWNITSNQTTAGQMKDLIDPNSPYYQQWATVGRELAAGNGFTNGTIMQTGILDSVMRGALPIAQSDAAAYAKAAGYNADMPNQFAVKDADIANTAGQFNAGQTNSMTQSVMANDTQRYGIDTSAATQRYSVDANTAAAKLQSQTQLAINASNVSSQDKNALLSSNTQILMNDKSLGVTERNAILSSQTQQIINSATLTSSEKNALLQSQTQKTLSDTSAETQRFVATTSAKTQVDLAGLNTASQKLISETHDANSVLLQNSSQATTMFTQYLNNIGTINMSTTMPEDSKKNAIEQQTATFNSAIRALRDVNPRVPDVSSALTFPTTAPATEAPVDPAALTGEP